MGKTSNDNSGVKSNTAVEAAAVFSFLAAILNNTPNETTVKNLRNYFLNNSNEVTDEMEKFLRESADASDTDIATELAVEWTRLFRGLSPQFGPPPPYTGVYLSKDGVGIDYLISVQNAYKMDGLAPDTGRNRDRTDYLGFELEFMAYLANQVATAQENNDKEKMDEYSRKLDNFAESFVKPWIAQFVNKALPYAKSSFFQGYLKLLNESLE